MTFISGKKTNILKIKLAVILCPQQLSFYACRCSDNDFRHDSLLQRENHRFDGSIYVKKKKNRFNTVYLMSILFKYKRTKDISKSHVEYNIWLDIGPATTYYIFYKIAY